MLAIHAAGQDGARAEAAGELFRQACTQGGLRQVLELVAGLARQNAHAFLVGHGLDERDARNRVGMHQGRAAQVDERGDLLGRLQRARLKLQRAQGLQPRQDGADEQQGQQKERAPKQVQPDAGALRRVVLGRLERGGAGGFCVDGFRAFGTH
ncbi:hypothetical protein SDC9_121474 [bioreactor metagenome]|uniref:Uncharacterized protein n=1 Tax=bioreactor metagenome TaxID=1076179 RepID=A0A645CC05_9ZZZZ